MWQADYGALGVVILVGLIRAFDHDRADLRYEVLLDKNQTDLPE